MFSPLQSSISPRNQVQIRWFLILWNRFEVILHNWPFSPIFIINSLSDLINFEEYIKNFLISLWIRPLFTIIPFNSIHFHQIGKFRIIFDTRPCEINDLVVSSRHRSFPSPSENQSQCLRYRHSTRLGNLDYLQPRALSRTTRSSHWVEPSAGLDGVESFGFRGEWWVAHPHKRNNSQRPNGGPSRDKCGRWGS